VKILTPILNSKENMNYSPKFSFINLKFNETSGVISKVYKSSELIKEDLVKNDEIEKYLGSDHSLELDSTANMKLGDFPLDSDLSKIISYTGGIKFST
jgi:hypothetical protein